ncbi:MAG: fasciclin domain-containing protein, partial [Bacteroidales bacterium]|nr:fasciclin domain-containing protein [Bacteroidales bacterium]
MPSCETDHYDSKWIEDSSSISQYLETNKEEFSKSYRLFDEGKILITLWGYNPHGEDYTLFLPTDEAIDNFIVQHPNYNDFEELLQDTNFIYRLARYHTLNRKVHTDEFPLGALNDRTLSGERLVANFYTDGDNQLIKINN